jgi:hypothetical protein
VVDAGHPDEETLSIYRDDRVVDLPESGSSQVDAARVSLATSAELVQERKQAFITAAVTGQFGIGRKIAEAVS